MKISINVMGSLMFTMLYSYMVERHCFHVDVYECMTSFAAKSFHFASMVLMPMAKLIGSIDMHCQLLYRLYRKKRDNQIICYISFEIYSINGISYEYCSFGTQESVCVHSNGNLVLLI